jgi:hypothetical protein
VSRRSKCPIHDFAPKHHTILSIEASQMKLWDLSNGGKIHSFCRHDVSLDVASLCQAMNLSALEECRVVR